MNQANNNITAAYLTFALLMVAIWLPYWWIKLPATLIILFTAYALLNEGDDNGNTQ